MHLELTVTLGDLFTMASFVITGVAVYVRLIERLKAIEVKLEPLWQDWIDRSR